jgi:D-alanyl-D-alanine dipeptidase
MAHGPFPVVVGRNGLAWGRGLSSPPAGQPRKREGDGKAPAGVFRVGREFGYEDAPGVAGFLHSVGSLECVDDSAFRFYNQLVDRSAVEPDWSSSEKMLRDDELYRRGAVIEHNAADTQRGAGSCIFLHIWRAPDAATAGCTAMAADDLDVVLARLRTAAAAVVVQAPAGELTRHATAWGLPSGMPVKAGVR